jgi:hypothetical protein
MKKKAPPPIGLFAVVAQAGSNKGIGGWFEGGSSNFRCFAAG